MNLALPTLALLALLLTACADRGGDEVATSTATGSAIDPPIEDAPAVAMPPEPPTPEPANERAGPIPAEGAIGFAGFGPAPFGADDEAVRQAWGRELDGLPRQSDACYYLSPTIQPGSGYGLAFMIANDKFVRIDVAREGISAPGGGGIGMSTEQIEALYPGLERKPHKYVKGGEYLRVNDPEGGDGVLVFEAVDGVVDEWRIGVPPQVDYVEGCS